MRSYILLFRRRRLRLLLNTFSKCVSLLFLYNITEAWRENVELHCSVLLWSGLALGPPNASSVTNYLANEPSTVLLTYPIPIPISSDSV